MTMWHGNHLIVLKGWKARAAYIGPCGGALGPAPMFPAECGLVIVSALSVYQVIVAPVQGDGLRGIRICWGW